MRPTKAQSMSNAFNRKLDEQGETLFRALQRQDREHRALRDAHNELHSEHRNLVRDFLATRDVVDHFVTMPFWHRVW